MSEKVLAWSVHFYTATGLIAVAGMAALIIRGGDASFRWAMLLMVAAMVIDATDGKLARKADVKRWAPGVDGRRLDDIVDFHTYTSLPLLLVWRAGLLPEGWGWVAVVPLLASAYGFSQTEAKTKDGFFLGFPSYWNVIAFYLYLLKPGSSATIAVLAAFAFLTFIPARYLYPSFGGPFSRAMTIFGAIWGVMLVLILTGVMANPAWVWLSLAYPIYYLSLSWWITLIRPAGG